MIPYNDSLSMNKVAIVHDWLVTYAGAERVLEQLLLLFPQADLFSICDFIPENERHFLCGRKPITSFIQNLPGARKHYRSYLPLMPIAIEQLDVSSYDVVISSSYAVSKGVITGPDQLHISYVHSPIRYAWDLQHQYLRETGHDTGIKGWLAKWFLHKIRLWDLRTTNGIDCFVANSNFIARRIWKVYRRRSEVIPPPVDVSNLTLCDEKQDFYLTASRLVPYKRIDLIVDAFKKLPDKRLIVIGEGPEMKKLCSRAGHNVTLLGFQPFEILRNHMQRAKAFVFAAEEDFGITPVEAQACGTPVIAFGKGGALETVIGHEHKENPTGLFFPEQSVDSIVDAIKRFEQIPNIPPQTCRDNAMRFSPEVFRSRFNELVNLELKKFSSSR